MTDEKAISFCRRLIPAIYADIKTHTRRVIIPQPVLSDTDKYRSDGIYDGDCGDGLLYVERLDNQGEPTEDYRAVGRPRYVPGDILWVKEEYYEYGRWTVDGKTKTGKLKLRFVSMTDEYGYPIYYPDTLPPDVKVCKNKANIGYFWRNSRYMPRRAARLFLLIKSVMAERLCSITPEDVIREGIRTATGSLASIINRDTFRELWDSLNKKRDYDWNSNPYVFVYEFERIKDYEKKPNKTNFCTWSIFDHQWECMDFVAAPFVDGGCTYYRPRAYSRRCFYEDTDTMACLNKQAIIMAKSAQKKAEAKE
jgi:hypothetical protein